MVESRYAPAFGIRTFNEEQESSSYNKTYLCIIQKPTTFLQKKFDHCSLFKMSYLKNSKSLFNFQTVIIFSW